MDEQELFSAADDQQGVMLHSIRMKMFIANVVCCIAGAVIMAVTSHYLLMAIFLSILVCMCFTGPLVFRKRITPETACLLPMLLLCFVYTPASWFTFDGPLGCTPYLTLVFSALIVLTCYRKRQTLLLTLYFIMIAALIVIWILLYGGSVSAGTVAGNVGGYALAAVLITFFIITMRRRNEEYSQFIMKRSIHDELTGLYNRRVIDQIFGIEEKRFTRMGLDYAVMMLDIDRFKQLNDDKGHPLGDIVLKDLAARIKTGIRNADYAVRYGGDEFMIVLTNATADTPKQIFNRINAAARDINADSFPITVSMGFALRSECEQSGEMIALADRRMYESKRQSFDEK